MKEELKIVRWIQFMRCTEMALKKLFTLEQWREIQSESKYRTVSLDKKAKTEVPNKDMRMFELHDHL